MSKDASSKSSKHLDLRIPKTLSGFIGISLKFFMLQPICLSNDSSQHLDFKSYL